MTILSREQIADVCRAAGFPESVLPVAVAVALAESGGDTEIVRVNEGGTAPGSRDRGLFQINDYWHGEVSDACAFDDECAAREAYRLSSGGTNWSPWNAYKSGAYLRHLIPMAAVASVAPGTVVRGWTHGSRYKGRPYAGRTLHNTVSYDTVTTYQSAGGWQTQIGRDATVYRDVPDEVCAWHVAATGWTAESQRLTRRRPPWLIRCPDGGVSDANYCALGIELVGDWSPVGDWSVTGKTSEPYTVWQYAALRRVLAQQDAERGALPTVGHTEVQTDRHDPVAFDWERAGFGPPGEDGRWYVAGDPLLDPSLLWPLAGVDPTDPLRGGYNFLDWTDSGHTPHPGVDLNVGAECHADRGLPVVAPAGGTVRFAGHSAPGGSGRGIGLNVWVEHPESEWGHFCHLLDLSPGLEGREVPPGEVLGHCGNTDGWACEHTHWEVMRRKPEAWDLWPYNWSQQEVARRYVDPLTWLVVRGATALTREDYRYLKMDEEQIIESYCRPLWAMAGQPWAEPAPGLARAWAQRFRDKRLWFGRPTGPEMALVDGSGWFQEYEKGGLWWYADGRVESFGGMAVQP